MSTDSSDNLLSSKLLSKTFGTRLFESEFFKVGNVSNLYDVSNRAHNAWELEFADLTSLIKDIKSGESRPKVAIATEDIVGPVRNGGIGTTYYYLSKMLADNGIDVSVLYMRGNHSEKETIEYWVDHYAKLGIKFVPVEDSYEKDNVISNSQRWVRPVYNLYQYLKDNHFDIVHVSEWRGTAYISLIAKQLGMQFSQTQFVIKCSSPWLWNRLYGNALVYNNADLTKMFFEKKSVELGDTVIGGSAHLIRWMISQGYDVKNDHTFVQPNVLLTDHLQSFIDNRTYNVEDIVDVSELVFFGRLEERKGITEFCDSIDILVEDYPDAFSKVKTISFMGKAGARLQSRPDISILDYIEIRSKNWTGIEVNILTEYQQYEALSYLLGGERLAVMPSRIENSSLAVYECLICGIPFIASYTGGTPELVDAKYHELVLFDTHPTCLAEILNTTLLRGAIIPLATFDNDQNNITWINFHKSFDHWNSLTAIPSNDVTDKQTPKVTIVIYHLDQPSRLAKTIESLQSQTHSDFDIVIVDDGSDKPESLETLQSLEELENVQVVRVKYFGPGYAYNYAVSEYVSHESYVYFTRAGNKLRLTDSLEQFCNAAEHSGSSLVTSFNYFSDGKVIKREIDFVENQNYNFFKHPKHDIDILVCVKAFKKTGGFNSDPHAVLETIEFSNELMLNGNKCMTIPEFLYSYDKQTGVSRVKRGVNFNSASFRVVRPYLIHSPGILNNILLVRDPNSRPRGSSSSGSIGFQPFKLRKNLKSLRKFTLRKVTRVVRRLAKFLYGVCKRFYKRNRYRVAKFGHTYIKPAIRKYPFLRWMEPPLKRLLEKYRAARRY